MQAFKACPLNCARLISHSFSFWPDCFYCDGGESELDVLDAAEVQVF